MRADKNRKPVSIDEDEICEYIVTKCRLDDETVEAVLDAEMVFMKRKGFVVEGDSPFTMPNQTVDDTEMLAFVVSQSGVAERTAKRILDTELEFLALRGVLDPEPKKR